MVHPPAKVITPIKARHNQPAKVLGFQECADAGIARTGAGSARRLCLRLLTLAARYSLRLSDRKRLLSTQQTVNCAVERPEHPN